MWRVAVVGLFGCGRISFDPTTVADGSIDGAMLGDASCVFGAWSEPIVLTAVNTPSLEYRPALSADQLTLLYQSDAIGGDYDLYRATRPTRSDAFENPVRLTALSSPASDGQAELSPDGLTLYFSSTRNGGVMRVFRATRATTGDEFVTFSVVPELAAVDGYGPSLPASGGELFFNSDEPAVLQRARLVGAAVMLIGAVSELNTPDAGWSTFLGDDTIFFTSDRRGDYDLFMATRDTTGVFGAATPVPGLSQVGIEEDDPEISRDGTTLIYSSRPTVGVDADLYMVTRPCL